MYRERCLREILEAAGHLQDVAPLQLGTLHTGEARSQSAARFQADPPCRGPR